MPRNVLSYRFLILIRNYMILLGMLLYSVLHTMLLPHHLLDAAVILISVRI